MSEYLALSSGRGRPSSDSPRSSVSSVLEKISDFHDGDYEFDEPPVAELATGRSTKAAYSRRHRLKLGLVVLLSIVILGLFTPAFLKASRQMTASSEVSTNGAKALTLKEMRSGAFQPAHKSISWIHAARDSAEVKGDYVIHEGGQFLLTSWANQSEKKLIADATVKVDGAYYVVDSVWLNSDHTKALLSTNKQKNWRHSSFAIFWILDLESRDVTPVNSNDPTKLAAFAEWSPRGDRVAFVSDNNLFLRHVGGENDGAVSTLTQDGGEQIFYGRPDWVYEEEVIMGARALWWSLNGDYLAFLRINETEVPEFPIPYFVQGAGTEAYPELVKIKYPKPGYSNPNVNILFLEVESEDVYYVPVEESPDPENIISEVTWTDNSKVIVRFSDRESDILKISVVDAKAREGKIVRVEERTGADSGWFEISQNTVFVPADADNGRPQEGYIDTIVVDGYNHLAFFSPIDASEPKQILTSGKWEVDAAPAAFDAANNLVYFLATEQSPVDRHLYSVTLNGTDFKPVTDTSEAYYGVSFSVDSRFVLLSYNGPDVPWQKVIDLSTGDEQVVEDNSVLKEHIKDLAVPKFIHSQIKVGVDEETGEDILANAREIRPASFDPKKKYPVLFQVYGGPGSQTVTKRFSLDFHAVLASEKDIIVVTVDGRGCGFMGRKFRAVVRDQLGHYEVLDQITAAKNWGSRSYVDEDRIAIWGWSYGGYMTLKTLEADAGETFKYGMSVAPVTDWRFYDSVYTERYMHTPQHNAKGYEESSVHRVADIGKTERFLVMHGTGDDNVHVQNTLVLLDKLDGAGVENYDVHVFPDSDHSIVYHNANTIVYDKLAHWINDAFAGKFKDLL